MSFLLKFVDLDFLFFAFPVIIIPDADAYVTPNSFANFKVST